MQNFVRQDGKIKYTNAGLTDIAGGDVVVVNGRICVAAADILVGDDGWLYTESVITLPKAAGALTKGQKAYWDAGAGAITGTALGNTFAGYVDEDAANADTTVQVELESQTAGTADNVLSLAGGADLPTTVAKVNAILTALKTAGLMVKDA